MQNLGTSAVIEGDAEGEARVVSGEVDRFENRLLEIVRKPVEPAEMADADALRVQFVDFLKDGFSQKFEDALDFGFGAVPVFGGERE